MGVGQDSASGKSIVQIGKAKRKKRGWPIWLSLVYVVPKAILACEA